MSISTAQPIYVCICIRGDFFVHMYLEGTFEHMYVCMLLCVHMYTCIYVYILEGTFEHLYRAASTHTSLSGTLGREDLKHISNTLATH